MPVDSWTSSIGVGTVFRLVGAFLDDGVIGGDVLGGGGGDLAGFALESSFTNLLFNLSTATTKKQMIDRCPSFYSHYQFR